MLELQEFLNDRAVRHKDYFEKNELVKSHYKFVKKIVDYFAGLCYNIIEEQKLVMSFYREGARTISIFLVFY